MIYRQDTDGCFTACVGESGLDEDEYRGILGECAAALDFLRAGRADRSLPFLDMDRDAENLGALEAVAQRHIEEFDDVVFLGIGGSNLGGRTLCGLAAAPRPGADGALDKPRLHFMDNVDPDSFARLFTAIDPARTGFITTSKSGATAETLSQLLVSAGMMRERLSEAALGEHFTAITEPGARPLRAIADRFGMPVLDHHPGVGGRFSALTVVGLLPAMIAGLDAEALRGGAADTIAPLAGGAAPDAFAPAIGAAINIGLNRTRGVGATVLMPYLDRMADFGLWFRQLWAESLGKNGFGTTPIDALGAVDQHSQLQLYLDGPNDKMFTLIFAPAKGGGGIMDPELAADAGLDYLAGRRMGDLLDAEQRATKDTLIQHDRPTRIITIDALDEAAMGALMMHFMAETVIAAHLLGVNAFDQPAVEDGKIKARRYLEEGGA